VKLINSLVYWINY